MGDGVTRLWEGPATLLSHGWLLRHLDGAGGRNHTATAMQIKKMIMLRKNKCQCLYLKVGSNSAGALNASILSLDGNFK